MALSGRLSEMNLLEILQIVAYSKKTGTLELSGSTASGAILLRSGRVICARSSSTEGLFEALAREPLDATRLQVLREQIRTSLRELVGLRDGSFDFHLEKALSMEWNGLDISSFLLTDGVDPQELMLELARELDESRRRTSQLIASPDVRAPDEESAAEGERVGGAGNVLVVDDEAPILEIVADALRAAGFRVSTALGPAEAVARLEELGESSEPLVVVTDVAMPSSGGDSFRGGFEVVERLRLMRPGASVLLMTETLSPSTRARAMQLGVRKVAHKPALTKLDADEYESDLRAFADVVRKETTELVAAAADLPQAAATVPSLDHDVMFEFLRTMVSQLTHPTHGIARMVLRVGAKHVERALLFLVKGPRAKGLAGVHLGRPTTVVTASTKEIAFELQQVEPFAEVVYARSSLKLSYNQRPLPAAIDVGRAVDYALLPLLHSHEVIGILLCDNPNTGAPVSRLAGLELFLAQAGMAMENASLHRRLREIESPFSIEDQGPLTQELTRVVRGRT